MADNLLDKASILLTPTAYNDGSMLSVKPENGDGDFTFSRGFNGSRTNSSGNIVTESTNIPRIDYTDGCGSWLLEPQSTNLITYSEDFSQWDLTRAISTANTSISPDGTNNAYKLQSNATGASGSWYRELVSAFSGSHNYSVFAKSGTTDFMQLRIDGIGGVVYDLSDGTVKSQTSAIGSVEDYGNGWYRCSLQATVSSSTALIILVGNENMTTVNWFTTSGDNIYIYGAQLEQQSYATSYIPTNGSIATRLADVAANSGNSSLINSTEGVLYAEVAALANSGVNRMISVSDGSLSNFIWLYFLTNNKIEIYVYSGGVNVVFKLYTFSNSLNFNKIAVKWKQDDFAFWINGVEIHTSNTGSHPIGLNSLNFNRGDSSTFPFFGKAKALAVYKEALTDAELQSLTTI